MAAGFLPTPPISNSFAPSYRLQPAPARHFKINRPARLLTHPRTDATIRVSPADFGHGDILLNSGCLNLLTLVLGLSNLFCTGSPQNSSRNNTFTVLQPYTPPFLASRPAGPSPNSDTNRFHRFLAQQQDGHRGQPQGLRHLRQVATIQAQPPPSPPHFATCLPPSSIAAKRHSVARPPPQALHRWHFRLVAARQRSWQGLHHSGAPPMTRAILPTWPGGGIS